MLSFEQLSTPPTEDQAFDTIVTRLTELGFSATSWQDGSVQYTLVRVVAHMYSKGAELVRDLLYSGFNDTATGDFLTRFSASHYDNTRVQPVAARYSVVHTTAGGSGPYVVAVGALTATNGNVLYRNITGDTLTSATPVTLTYEAEIPGTSGNTADGTITQLVTTLTGVTINNPTPSLVRVGTDLESETNLRRRNTTKWASLGTIERSVDGYENVILEVLPNYRVAVDDTNPRGPGTVDIYIASATGLASGGDVTAAQTAVDAKRSPTADVLVIAADAVTVDISETVYIPAAYDNAATKTLLSDAIAAYINSLPIGGQRLTTAATRVIPIDGLAGAQYAALPSIKNIDFSSPTADTPLTAFDVATVGSSVVTLQRV